MAANYNCVKYVDLGKVKETVTCLNEQRYRIISLAVVPEYTIRQGPSSKVVVVPVSVLILG